MTLNYLLIWIVGISAASLLLNSWRARPRAHGWVCATLLILGVLAVGMVWFPGMSGVLAGGPWLVLIVLPLLLNRRSRRLGALHCFDGAAQAASLAAILHPADGWGDAARAARAVRALTAGNEPAAAAEAGRIRSPGVQQTLARYALACRGAWGELLEVLPPGEAALLELRALAELGLFDDLVTTWQRVQPALQDSSAEIAWARLIVAAFGGDEVLTRHLLAGPLAGVPQDEQALAHGTALAAAGKVKEAARIFEALRGSARQSVRVTAIRRLEALSDGWGSVPPPVELTMLCARIRAEAAAEEGAPGAGVPATRTLIAVTVAVFVLQILLAGVSTRGLYEMGALLPLAVYGDGEWWRVIAALFLHAGGAHLLMNMFALYSLGAPLERRIGSPALLLLYLGAGIGSMGVIVGLVWSGLMEEHLVVGASGAVMGLVGATGAILWSRRRSSGPVQAELRSIGVVIGLQLIFDLMTPQVSSTGHLAGLCLGMIGGGLIARGQRAPG